MNKVCADRSIGTLTTLNKRKEILPHVVPTERG
jgi:hypothetical protein